MIMGAFLSLPKKRVEGHDGCVNPRDYITSERFIWDELLEKAEVAVRRVRENWKKSRKVSRILLSFPAEHVKADDGTTIRDIVSFAIPDRMTSFAAAVAFAKRTTAYALLLIERQGDTVKILLESHHGTRCWTFPVRWHGDIEALEKAEVTTDTESIGVLWRPRATGTS
jgi:hypothetical protein